MTLYVDIDGVLLDYNTDTYAEGAIELIEYITSEFDCYCYKGKLTIGYGPIKHIHDTSFRRYALQQNIYKFILEKNYGIKISAMKILVLHSDYDMPYLLDIPNLGTEVIQMLEIIKNKVK